jgi:1-acyl-sn-glycerol-3-phosphate acyltransferase
MTGSDISATPSQADMEARVLEVVRALARETGGERARSAASLRASFERDLGLGSLERVELLTRLESALGQRLEDRHLAIDTAAEMARALMNAQSPTARAATRAEPIGAASLQAPRARTVHEALFLRAQAEPGRPAVFFREGDGDERTITYGGLWAESAAVAGGLRAEGIGRGDAVALMLPTGNDFLRTFQGVLIAGAIPVPIYPPARLDQLDEYAGRQSSILADAAVKVLVTIEKAKPIATVLRSRVRSLRRVTTADELAERGEPWSSAEGQGGDPAFIQYTSGSTGEPKGVLLTHDNLLANIRAIAFGLQVQPTDVGASWLPLYHDMGLIGSWLFCLHQGLPLALQSPLSFLARPERWLWSIHDRRATLSAAPNFAYELCVRKIADSAIEGLDLSSWRCALNGAEPVNPDTVERFVARFSRYGFRREAMMPVYGLAENSVALCVPPAGRGPRVDRIEREAFERFGRAVAAAEGDALALRLLSVGAPLPEHEVLIVDDAGEEVEERTLGRLVFRGPSMTAGYFQKPEATAAIRVPGGFLDSGDLAYRADGEHYIAGRRKDLIIKAGRNFVPQEIEDAATHAKGVRRGCVVAFGVTSEEQGTERLVLAAETRVRDPARRERIAAEITRLVTDAVGMPPDHVALVPPGAVPKTSSGKVRRKATKDLYLHDALGRKTGTSWPHRLRLLAGLVSSKSAAVLRRTPAALYLAWLAIALPIVALPLCLAVVLVPRRRFAFACGRLTVRLGLRLALCRLSVEGKGRLPRTGPYLLASNHASYVDVPALMALLPDDFLFVSKVEALRYPVVGTYLRACGHLTVERFDARKSVKDAGLVARAVEGGQSVLVFPEGTFTPEAGLRPFRMGVFKTAVETGVPVVPMALRGTRRILRDGSWWPRPGAIHLWIGEPLLGQGTEWRSMVDLRDRTAAAIAAHSGEPRLDLVGGGPVRSIPD